MGSASRGNAAEAAVLHALVKRGLDVFVPFGSGHPFDLAVYVPDTGFLRVQCKRGWALRGCIVFNTYSTDHGSGPRGYAGLADLFGVYFPPSEEVFLTPIDAVAATEGASVSSRRGTTSGSGSGWPPSSRSAPGPMSDWPVSPRQRTRWPRRLAGHGS